MKASLLRRMILAQGLVMLGFWVVNSAILLTWTMGWMVPQALDLPLERQAATLLKLLQDEQDPARFQVQAHRLQELAESYAPYRSERGRYRSVFQIIDGQGRLRFRSDAAPLAVMTQAGSGRHNIVVDGATWRVVVMEDATTHLRVLVADAKATRWHSVKADVFQRTPLAYCLWFLLIALLTWLVSRVALKPLRRLAEAVEARRPGDLSQLEGHLDLVETRPLVAALNRLFQRVQALLATQRRFVADAAHELRTPLAVVAAQAHVLTHTQDPLKRKWAEQELQQGVARGAQVIGQLLSVAHLEAEGPGLALTQLDLAALAQERVASLVPKAVAKGQDLGYEGPEALPWRGDAAMLGSAIDNLLVNAMLYTPTGSVITLRLRPRVDEVILEVEDTGPGIPEALCEALFERFARLPGHQEPGSGLGLAIVRQVAELHGGSATLEPRRAGTGLLAMLHLPRQGPMIKPDGPGAFKG